MKVNVTSENFRRSNIKNPQPATERLLSIAPSVISKPSSNKIELENNKNAYVDTSELENKPLTNEGSLLIFESFEDLYEGRLQRKNA